MTLLTVLAALIAAGVAFICWRVAAVDFRVEQLAKLLTDEQAGKRVFESVHDTAHPAFSVAQLARTRYGFEVGYKKQLRLEAELYGKDEWRKRPKGKGPISPSVSTDMREICEAMVYCESVWQEYLWMVDSNLAVASGRETRSAIHKSYEALYPRTRRSALYSQRIEKLLSSWTARLSGGEESDVEIEGPNLDVETFDFAVEIRNKYAALR